MLGSISGITITATAIYRTASGLALAGLGWLVVFPIKRVVAVTKEEWAGLKSKVDTIETGVKAAVDNHLSHIEVSTVRTAEILDEMRGDQKELVGYLKGLHERHKS